MKLGKLFWAGVILITVTAGPLLLYVIFGPKDGNPIGLGLLFFFGAPIGFLLLIIGVVTSLRAK